MVILKEAVENKPLLRQIQLRIRLFENVLEIFERRPIGRSCVPKTEEKRRVLLSVFFGKHNTEQINVMFIVLAGLAGDHAYEDLHREDVRRSIN